MSVCLTKHLLKIRLKVMENIAKLAQKERIKKREESVQRKVRI